MFKILAIFLIGLVEQLLYTKYLISVDKRQSLISTVYMIIYMSLYLVIVAYAMKDSNTIPLLIAYALACGLGNFIAMKQEIKKENNEKNKKL
jgi:uncharacterized protein YebE (UPF0316 family)